MNARPRLFWLHLSDIHFGPSTSWRDYRAQDTMLSFLSSRFHDYGCTPDLIFCAGDIAYGTSSGSALADQYKQATSFFDKLRRTCGNGSEPLEKDRLFFVPGNHDVNRERINADAQERLIDRAKTPYRFVETINNNWHNNSYEIRDALRRLEDYRAFISQYLPMQDDSGGRCCFARTIDVRGWKVGVIGLNSCWSSAGNEDDRHLWMAAEAQINNLASTCKSADLRFAVTHHPIDWINEADRDVLTRRLGADFDLLLHGHTHNAWVTHGGTHATIASGAIGAEGAEEFGFNLGSLDFETGACEIKLFSYSRRDGDWAVKPVPGRAPDGIWRFKLEPRARNGARRGAVTTRDGGPIGVYSDWFARPALAGTNDDYLDDVTGGAAARDVAQFISLYQDSFGHHLIEDLAGDPDELHPEIGDATRIVDKDNLDAYFIRNRVIEPRLTRTPNNDLRDMRDNEVSFQVFLKEITDPPLRQILPADATAVAENRVSYLIGEAGMGKTLTVLKLLDEIRRMEPDHRGYRVVPVYADLHQLHQRGALPAEELTTVLTHVMRRFAAKAANFGADGLEGFGPLHEINGNEMLLQKLALHVARQKLFPLLIFDNLDRFYFENARYSFFPLYAQQRDDRIEDFFLALINCFVDEFRCGKIGASVVFVCRKYVFTHCRQIQDYHNRSRAIRAKHPAYQLMSMQGSDVLQSRLGLIRDAVTAIAKKYKHKGDRYLDQVSQLEHTVTQFQDGGDSTTINLIWKLSHQGLRSFMDFLGELKLDYRKDYQLVDRLFRKPHNLLRLYITNNKKRYSQQHSHFPNLYLLDTVINPNAEYPAAHKPHVHTYWLKYFLLRCARLQPANTVLVDQLIDYFVRVGKYEDHLVRLAIGSLADPSAARCFDIVPKREATHPQYVQLSERGKVLIATEGPLPLCFSLDYLQLVTDDFWLSLPKKWISNVYVDATIGHTLKTQATYGEEAWRTLTKKIPAVLHFLRILSASLKWEHEMRPELFKTLPELAPDFDVIAKELLATLNRVLTQFEGRELSADPKSQWEALKEDSSFEDFFRGYGDSKAVVSA